jgi:hypothetical protein
MMLGKAASAAFLQKVSGPELLETISSAHTSY